MGSREELIKILDLKFGGMGEWVEATAESIADFIIADRKRICGPLTSLGDIYFDSTTDHKKHIEAIFETLKLAGIEEGK